MVAKIFRMRQCLARRAFVVREFVVIVKQPGRETNMQERLTPQAALALLKQESVFSLGRMAHARRMQKHPDSRVTYIVDRNINYTNVCISGCKFCAFFRAPGDEGGYVLSREELAAKVQETVDLGGYQILLQGGMHPDLDMEFYEGMLSFLKERFPQVAVHGFSPSEIWYLGQESGLGHGEVIRRLVAAGLDSIPGGGAEILVDRVREDVSPRKATADQWLEVMREAHLQGLRTTATMMFGEGETIEERIEHLDRLRTLQDETGGFTAFIPWTFQPDNTRLPRPEASSEEYLKMLALSRLYLDNIDNVQASWVTQGPLIGQLALFWGANDFGSTMIEENVVAAAGVHFRLPEGKLRHLVESAGFTPCRRRMDYTLME
jgi:cyclic dehypoxanthinyl futalosine synthase